MDYTQVPEAYKEEYRKKFIMPAEGFSVGICRDDPVKFAYFMLGKTLRDYQAYMIDEALKNRYSAWCLPRQLGKSTVISILALWAVYFNKYNLEIKNRMSSGASAYIMSRSEDQAKELMLRIRELIRDGDAWMAQILRKTAKRQTNFFSGGLVQPDTTTQITFSNGSFIKCVPATDAIRGKSADWMFIDEAAFLKNDNPDRLYNEGVEPTISQTRGRMVISSTPKGQQGFFYKTLDPFEHFGGNDFFKIWFHYSVFANDLHISELLSKRKRMFSEGNSKEFEQEYEAKFVSSRDSFYDSTKIDESTDSAFAESEDMRREYSLGIDYGMVHSRTAVALSYHDVETDKIITAYVKRFPKGYDINQVIPFIAGLKQRFNINTLVVDDCPEGFAINHKLMDMGYNVTLFNFSSVKTENYCSYRSKMNKGLIGFIPDKELLMEYKGLQQEETVNGKLKIYKGGGLTDDLCDAVIMSASTWLGEEGQGFEVFLV